MNTRLLMRASAALLGTLGLGATFFPQEIVLYASGASPALAVLAVQVMGALYIGFALLDWMAQGNLIGGIYSRPVAIGNLTHFLVASLAMLKGIVSGVHAPVLVTGAVIYVAFAVLFARVAFLPPAPTRDTGA